MKYFLIGTFLFCLQFHTYSQIDTPFLSQVGIPDSIQSSILDEQRSFYVQLPASYNSNEDKRYPVIYVLDGDVLLPAVTNVHSFYSGGFMPESVIIGIANDKNRMRDLTVSEVTTMWGRPIDQENGQADQFLKFIREELIPHVESKYPVTEYRTLIGHSHGGSFTLNALLKDQETFKNFLSIDPSVEWDDLSILKAYQNRPTEMSFEGKALYMTMSGQLHMADPSITIENVMEDSTDFTQFSRAILSFKEELDKNPSGLYFDWKFYPMDLHGTIPLPSIMDGLISIFSWYQMEDIHKVNDFGTPKETLYAIIKNRENKLKQNFGYFEPPYPSDLMNVLGYMSMDMQQFEKAKMYLDFAIEFYPENANSYDSMADYYERTDDLDNALVYVKKAFDLSGSSYHEQRIQTLSQRIAER
jgi:predicted alpha/beta superfamily hydrolase